ncbi:flagellar basal-body rod protein FlgF [Desulfococcus sp.]|uniref:flagellar basal-body rod protein FlgF n=1 Tax=Desulfococcus sp. TaxID=2025834 RepID=UPI0035930463
MSGAIYMGASGAVVQQLRLEILSNNLANLGTSGFKRDLAVFSEAAQPPGTQQGAGAAASGDPRFPHPVLPFGQSTDFSQGSLETTDQPLDVALNGDGFFSIQTPKGVEYTRQGSFSLNAESRLVTPEGFPVLGESGPITIEGEKVTITGEGDILVDDGEVGRLQIVDFSKPYRLKRTEGTRFVPENPNAAGAPPETTTVVQGAVEVSNTEAITAMTQMIEVNRLFESYQKVIQTTSEMDQKAARELGRIE